MKTRPVVFVIDDEETIRGSLSKLLAAIAVPCETFASAEAFLAGYAGQQPACLLVDVRMPGMSGLDLIEEIGRRGLSLPAIVMTGHTDLPSLERLDTIPTIGFLEKPFSVGDLRPLLERWWDTLEDWTS